MEKLYKKVGKRYKEVEPQRFGDIDFFEFSFLVESCIPPSPIARAYFWQNVIDKYYYVLTKNERERLYEWINRHYSMESGVKSGNEDCLLFNARFDKDNQYLVSTLLDGENKETEAFLLNGSYYTSKNRFINEKYITKVEKL